MANDSKKHLNDDLQLGNIQIDNMQPDKIQIDDLQTDDLQTNQANELQIERVPDETVSEQYEHSSKPKKRLFNWIKNRNAIAIESLRPPSKSNRVAIIIFFIAMNLEMALTIPGLPTGLGLWADYLIIGSIFVIAASVIFSALLYLFSFFYLERIAGWLVGISFVTVQSLLILNTLNWGLLTVSIVTGIIIVFLIGLSLFISYLYVEKQQPLRQIIVTVTAMLSVIIIFFSVKGYWDDLKKAEYIKQYSDFLLKDQTLLSEDKDSSIAVMNEVDNKTLDTAQNNENRNGDSSDQVEGGAVNKLQSFLLQKLDQQLAVEGPYKYNHYDYSSNQEWKENAREDQLYVAPMDGSTVLKDWSWTKELYWGFSEQEIAIDGQMWLPEGEGPFPIVFIMHGNHLSEEDSSDGYAYLGELLASHGMIVCSIDANFLNYSVWSGIVDDDQKLRSWLMLAHLNQFNELDLRADWDNVALIGHSRGGQAAAMAVDAKQWYPEEEVINILDKIKIKAVIAIAPTDYYVDSKLAYIKNINYLTLHGTMDSDLTESFGERQYERTKFTEPGHFKATVELYHANHGQFNTVWGKYDEQFPGALALNTADLMSGEDQRLAAKMYIRSFLEASFDPSSTLEAVFQDFRVIGDQLPLTGYVTRYSSSSTKYWYTFELPQVAEELVRVSKDTSVTSIDLRGRSDGNKQNRVIWVTWPEMNSEVQFPITANMNRGQRDQEIEAIVISLARAERMVNPFEKQLEHYYEQKSKESMQDNVLTDQQSSNDIVSEQLDQQINEEMKLTEKELQHALQFEQLQQENNHALEPDPFTGLQLTLKINAGQWGEQSVDLSTYYHILHPAAHDFTKSDFLEGNIKKGKYDVSVEPLLQTYVIPISLIEQETPRDGVLFVSDLEKISLQFNSEKGSIIIDALGYIAKGGHYVEYSR